VVASTDWTVIAAAAVTGITAVVVGLVGYFSTRLSADAAKRQVDAEMERLQAQHDEAHLQRREGSTTIS
jgi:uncharacterized membrane-anchored protein YhcB (DUF1043 family)